MIIIVPTIKYGSTYKDTFTMGVCSNFHGYFFQVTWGGGDPELGLRDLAALRSKTFTIPSYPFYAYATLSYATEYAMIHYNRLRYATLHATMCNISIYYVI